jgi:hypothetical protein
MSELQIGLAGLGVLVVICVIGFNKFQEIRSRREGGGHFTSGHEDVLLKPGNDSALDPHGPKGGRDWVDPTWSAESEPAADPQPEPGLATEVGEPSFSLGRVHQEQGVGAAVKPPLLDDRIDFIAVLSFTDALLGSHLVMEIERFTSARLIGCDGFNPPADAWEELDRDAVYEKARIGIQLSDRGGPLRTDELEVFHQWVSQTAIHLNATVSWSEMQNPMQRAADLDAFCAEVDLQVGVNLVAGGPLAETKIRGLAEAHGFRRESDGVFRRRGDDGMELLSLRQSAPTALSFVYDVPRVPREAAAFGLMMHCARILGKGLDARIVDDNGRPLDDAMQNRIQSSLAGIHARMDAAGMPAGGPLAQRVFM